MIFNLQSAYTGEWLNILVSMLQEKPMTMTPSRCSFSVLSGGDDRYETVHDSLFQVVITRNVPWQKLSPQCYMLSANAQNEQTHAYTAQWWRTDHRYRGTRFGIITPKTQHKFRLVEMFVHTPYIWDMRTWHICRCQWFISVPLRNNRRQCPTHQSKSWTFEYIVIGVWIAYNLK